LLTETKETNPMETELHKRLVALAEKLDIINGEIVEILEEQKGTDDYTEESEEICNLLEDLTSSLEQVADDLRVVD
jgi:hypothetical protein